jgi:hypothetical protein
MGDMKGVQRSLVIIPEGKIPLGTESQIAGQYSYLLK